MRKLEPFMQSAAALVIVSGLMSAAAHADDKTLWVKETVTVKPVYSNPKDQFAVTFNPYLRPRQVTVRRQVVGHWDARRQSYNYVDSHGRNQWVAGTRPDDKWENGWYHHVDEKGVEWITTGGAWQFYKLPGLQPWFPVNK